MNKRLLVGIVLAALTAVALAAEVPAMEEKAVALATVGDVPAGITDRVRELLVTYLGPVRLRAQFDVSVEPKREKLLAGLMRRVGSNDVCLLVLAGAADGGTPVSSVCVTGAVGVVFVSALESGRANAATNRETFIRRVEKESIRAAALALGLRPCPHHRCALYVSESEDNLDAKGCNLCPPCRVKSEKRLAEKGVKLE